MSPPIDQYIDISYYTDVDGTTNVVETSMYKTEPALMSTQRSFFGAVLVLMFFML